MNNGIWNLNLMKTVSIFTFWLIVIACFSGLIIEPNNEVSAATGQALIITSIYTVNGAETWGSIQVKNTGKLVVPGGSSLNVEKIQLETGSSVELTGGNVSLKPATYSGYAEFSGECDYFKILDHSRLELQGGNGWANTSSVGPYEDYIHISRGGEATVDIVVNKEAVIDNSTITLIGGNGFDLPPSNSSECYAWTNGADLNGYIASGGISSFSLNLKGSSSLIIRNCDLTIIGGRGGNAANGSNGSKSEGGCGGGYTGGSGGGGSYQSGYPGGDVSGFVGAGGEARLKFIASADITVSSSNLKALGGKGGDGGHGGTASSGPGWGHCGGGGGGYGGGGGGATYSNAGSSGKVSGYVGSGGNCKISFESEIHVKLLNSVLEAWGGFGGTAGDGGSGGSIADCGGGGFGGGGGGGFIGNGGDGTVYDYVGSGGVANISISSDTCEINNAIIHSKGGSGGDAGDGGNGTACTAGGGGYGGGGGGNDDNELVGDGKAYDHVGSGGNSYFITTVASGTMMDSEIKVTGGHGGLGGDGGDEGGAGGGGFGGGGGGANAYGGDGEVSDYVGNGGMANCLLFANAFSILGSELIVTGGDGGDGGAGGICEDPSHGAGGGGYAGCGAGGGGAYHGGKGKVTGLVGDGGDSLLGLYFPDFSMDSASNLNVFGGTGGTAPDSPGGGAGGGEGTGRMTSNGTAVIEVPNWAPLLSSPANTLTMNQTPTFNWALPETSQISDYLKSFTIQIDNDFDFSSPVIHYSLTSTQYTPTIPLEPDIYFWRVRANYKFYNTNLNAWSNVWGFTLLQDLPWVEDFQLSKEMIYRNEIIEININGSDYLDAEFDLTCEVEYFPPTGPWTGFDEITYITTTIDGYWHAVFTPVIKAELGIYSVRIRFIDSENNEGSWQEDWFEVTNNLPSLLDVKFSTTKVYRADSLKIFMNATDMETSESDLTCKIQYLSSTSSWSFPNVITYVSDHWEIMVTPPINAEIGDYNILLNITDGDGNFTGWIAYEAAIEIKNNLPVILPSCDNFVVAAFETEFNLTEYGTDLEDPDEDLKWDIDQNSVNYGLFSATLEGHSNNILKIQPLRDVSGTDDITLILTDMDDDSITKTNVTLHINRKPMDLFGVSTRIVPGSINISKGESENVTLIIKNIGLLPDVYWITIDLNKFSVFNFNISTKQVSLEKEQIAHVTIRVYAPNNTVPGEYITIFKVSSDYVSSDANLQINVESKGDSNGSDNSWFDTKNLVFILIFILIIFIVILILFQLLMRRKQMHSLKRAFTTPDEFIEPRYGPDASRARLAPPPPRSPSATTEQPYMEDSILHGKHFSAQPPKSPHPPHSYLNNEFRPRSKAIYHVPSPQDEEQKRIEPHQKRNDIEYF